MEWGGISKEKEQKSQSERLSKINFNAIRVLPLTSSLDFWIYQLLQFSFSSFSFSPEKKSRHIFSCLRWNHNIYYVAGFVNLVLPTSISSLKTVGSSKSSPVQTHVHINIARLTSYVMKHMYFLIQLLQRRFIE